ncbi:MAG: primosomal protein N' [Dehalococcoidia bacterium]
MKYAEVAVNAPVAGPRTFSYSVPPHLAVSPGSAVWVPFGSRTLQGMVFQLTDFPQVEETRDISEVIEPSPLLSPDRLQLARWISGYYLASCFESAALMLPPAFERRTLTFVELLPHAPREAPEELAPGQRKIYRILREEGRVDTRQLEKNLSRKQVKSTIDTLVKMGVALRTTELERPRVKPKNVSYIRLAVDPVRAGTEVSSLERKRAHRQADLLRLLLEEKGELPLSDAVARSGASSVSARALERKGLVTIEQVRVQRDPLAHRSFVSAGQPQLTPGQKSIWERIGERIGSGLSAGSRAVFLLHGITGSGKTEIYLRALAETVAMGKKGIVLVPEIALTPQTIERFASRFPGRVAVLHSKLSPGEQFDEWHRIRQGDFDVVIGSRSAIFSPQPELGLIVIDEEHEWTYKQHDKSPLYHARDVALKLAEITGAIVILGSATPALESYHRARKGDYQLIELPERVCAPSGGPPLSMPEVEVVDMREELKRGNRSIFSRGLAGAIEKALGLEEQVILFLNRRGAASFVQCRDCGHVMSCRRCDIALTYHPREERLICHLCNYKVQPPTSCPECWSRRIKFLGIGTQRVEDETGKRFPGARVIRWDRDVTEGRHSHEEILNKFQSHQADILIGTQMIAKGLDIPLVTVVGAINADVGLYLPDFRSSERTFQLLSQVTGRAGRGEQGGRAIIQTYSPAHHAIISAAGHDYRTFYENEIGLRYQYGLPPFTRLVQLIYAHTNPQRCREEAERMATVLRQEVDSQGLGSMRVIGPSPAFTPRLRGRSRWQVSLQGTEPVSILCQVSIPQGWVLDVDPVGLT